MNIDKCILTFHKCVANYIPIIFNRYCANIQKQHNLLSLLCRISSMVCLVHRLFFNFPQKTTQKLLLASCCHLLYTIFAWRAFGFNGLDLIQTDTRHNTSLLHCSCTKAVPHSTCEVSLLTNNRLDMGYKTVSCPMKCDCNLKLGSQCRLNDKTLHFPCKKHYVTFCA